jgi:chemotaxis protein methyltransferase CheR
MSLRTPDLRHVRFEGVSSPAHAPAAPQTTEPGRQRRDPAADPAPSPGAEFAAWVLARAGLDSAEYRGEPLVRRVPACLRALKVDSVEAARAAIESRPGLLETALSALVIGVTAFFRDADAFDTLRDVAIPEWQARPGPVRVWSAGCSNGAELYSVAILLAEAGLLDTASLLGTDCRASAIEEARRGRYAESALTGMPAEWRAKYFAGRGGAWQLDERLRSRTAWRVADVLATIEAGPWDLVLCRNLTIYLDGPANAHVLRETAATLASGGFMLVGRAERLAGHRQLRPAGRCLYRT